MYMYINVMYTVCVCAWFLRFFWVLSQDQVISPSLDIEHSLTWAPSHTLSSNINKETERERHTERDRERETETGRREGRGTPIDNSFSLLLLLLLPFDYIDLSFAFE